MIQLKDISNALRHYNLYDKLPFIQVEQFAQFAQHIKHEIQITQPKTANLNDPPLRLPLYIHKFLWDIVVFTDEETMQAWVALQHIIWNGESITQDNDLTMEELILFQVHRTKLNGSKTEAIGEYHLKHKCPDLICNVFLAAHIFYPPTLTCYDCGERLSSHSHMSATYFSENKGPLPSYSSSLQCKEKFLTAFFLTKVTTVS